jgi:uncharacterized protein YciI
METGMLATHRFGTLFSIWLTGTALLTPSASANTPAKVETQPAAFLVIYRAGPKWPAGKTLAELPLREHGLYMLELHKRGVMQMAGSFADNSGGAAVLNVDNIESARAIADADPAVTGGLFVYELKPWRLVPWNEVAVRQGTVKSEASVGR